MEEKMKNKKTLSLIIIYSIAIYSIAIMGYSIANIQKLNELQAAYDFEVGWNWVGTSHFNLDEPYTSAYTMSFLKRMFLPENENTTVTITYDGSYYLINHTEYRDGEILMYSNTFVEYIDDDFDFSYGKP